MSHSIVYALSFAGSYASSVPDTQPDAVKSKCRYLGLLPAVVATFVRPHVHRHFSRRTRALRRCSLRALSLLCESPLSYCQRRVGLGLEDSHMDTINYRLLLCDSSCIKSEDIIFTLANLFGPYLRSENVLFAFERPKAIVLNNLIHVSLKVKRHDVTIL